jgi:hypothetical protein
LNLIIVRYVTNIHFFKVGGGGGDSLRRDVCHLRPWDIIVGGILVAKTIQLHDI